MKKVTRIDFERFLELINVRDKFKENSKKFELIKDEAVNSDEKDPMLFLNAFTWADSKEGRDFWKRVNSLWVEIIYMLQH